MGSVGTPAICDGAALRGRRSNYPRHRRRSGTLEVALAGCCDPRRRVTAALSYCCDPHDEKAPAKAHDSTRGRPQARRRRPTSGSRRRERGDLRDVEAERPGADGGLLTGVTTGPAAPHCPTFHFDHHHLDHHHRDVVRRAARPSTRAAGLPPVAPARPALARRRYRARDTSPRRWRAQPSRTRPIHGRSVHAPGCHGQWPESGCHEVDEPGTWRAGTYHMHRNRAH